MKKTVLNAFARHRARTLPCLFGLLLAALPLPAQTLQWDANGTAAGVADGGGAWNTSELKWWDGAGNVSWNNALNAVAVFGNGGVVGTTASAATITVSGTVQAGGLEFAAVNLAAAENRAYIYSGGAIALADGAFIRLGNGTSNVGNARLTINSALAGRDLTIAKTGSDLALLHLGGANTWTGRLTVSAEAGSAGVFLNVTNQAAIASLDSVRVLAGNSVILGYTPAGATAAAFEIAGNGNSARGAIRFDQSVTLSGPITLLDHAGISANTAAPPTGTLAGSIGEAGGSRALTINPNGSTGTIVLAAANRFTGGLVLNSGTLRIGHAGALNADAPNLLTFAANTNAKTVSLNGFSIRVAGLSTLGTSDVVTVQNAQAGAASLTVSGTGTQIFAGILADGAGGGALALVKSGSGTQTLSGTASTYSGGTALHEGVLRIAGDRSLGAVPVAAEAANVSFNGGTLQFAAGGSALAPSLAATRGLTVNAGGGTLDTQANTVWLAAPVHGAGPLVKTGSGRLVLAAAGTHGGELLVQQGSLEVRHAQALGSADGRTRLVSGTRLDLAGGVTVADEWLITPYLAGVEGANTWAGLVQAAADATLTFEAGTGAELRVSGEVNAADIAGTAHSLILTGAGTGTVSGMIQNSLTVSKMDSGTWTLSGSNRFANGFTLTQGRLILGSAGALNAAAPNVVTFANNANSKLLSLAGTSSQAGGLSAAGGTGVVTENGGATDATLTLRNAAGQTHTYLGTLADGSGGGRLALTKAGAGTQVLGAASTYTGATTVAQGSLRLNFDAAGAPATNLLSASSPLILNGGTLALAGSAAVANGQTVNGLTVAAGSSTILLAAHATTPQNLLLDLGAISLQGGGTVNFVLPAGTPGAAHGVRTTAVNTAAGILGGWATVNGSDWAAVSGGNVVAYSGGYAEVTRFSTGTGAQGPIPNSATANVRIVNGGSSGNVALGNAGGITDIHTLLQAAGDAVVGSVAADSLRLGVSGGILLASGAGNLTLGSAAGNGGTLTAGGPTAGTAGELLFMDQVAGQTTTVHALVRNNGAGAVSLAKSGPGTLVLTGTTSDYSGGSFFNGGIVRITADRSLGAVPASAQAGSLTFNGGTLQWGAALTLSANRGISLLAGGGVLDVQAQSTTYGGRIAGPGALTKAGTGTLTLSGANSHDGETVVSAGVLAVTHNQALGGTLGGTLVANGSLLQLGNGITVTGELITINGNGGNNNGALQAATGATATWAGDILLGSNLARVGGQSNSLLTVSGVIQNGSAAANSLAISTSGNNGVVLLSGANTYTGATQIVRGTLRLGRTNSLPAGTVLTVYTAGTVTETTQFDLNGYDQTLAGLTSVLPSGSNDVVSVHNSAAGLSTLTVNQAANQTFHGKITGHLALIKDGAGTLTLTNTYNTTTPVASVSTYTGKTTVRAGTLALSGSGNLGATPWIQVDAGALLSLAGRTGGAYTLSGAVLSGRGSVNGRLIVAGSSVLRPGDSSGAPDLAGDGTGELQFQDLSLAGGAPALRALFQLGGTASSTLDPLAGGDAAYFAGADAGGRYDSLQVNGNLALNAGGTLRVELLGSYTPQLGDVFNLLDWGTLNLDGDGAGGADAFSLADLDLSSANAALGALGQGWYFETDLFLQHGLIYVAVPEPGRVALLFGGLLVLVLRRRRR